MNNLHINSPLLESKSLSKHVGASVWLKMEALQPSGAFKTRGIGHACQTHAKQGKKRFVSSSGGNAGLAVAYCGRRLKIPVTVVVPKSTSERAIELIKQESAEVIVYGASWNEAHSHALELMTEQDAYIHPFDDPLLWTGHATMVDEIAEAGLRPDLIVLSVGGGGLLCGVCEGLERNRLDDVATLAVETSGAASLHHSLQAGHRIELESVQSLATSLAAKRVAEQAFTYAQEKDVHTEVVTDSQAIRSCERFLNDHRVLVEPACGAALAPVYEKSEYLSSYETILVIVCGGVGISLEKLEEFKALP